MSNNPFFLKNLPAAAHRASGISYYNDLPWQKIPLFVKKDVFPDNDVFCKKILFTMPLGTIDGEQHCGFVCGIYKEVIKQNVCKMANSLLDYLDLKHVKKQLIVFYHDNWLYVKEKRIPEIIAEDKKIIHLEIDISYLKDKYDSKMYSKEDVNDQKMCYGINRKIPGSNYVNSDMKKCTHILIFT